VGLVGYSAAGEAQRKQSQAQSPSAALLASGVPITLEHIQPVITTHCLQCHGEQVQMKNIRLDSLQAIDSHALGIYQQVVTLKAMPLNNVTQMTDAERHLIKNWYEARQ
jgi:uncharacterized membrane protein